MAKLVDAPDLGSGNSGCVGSSPIRRTVKQKPAGVQRVLRVNYALKSYSTDCCMFLALFFFFGVLPFSEKDGINYSFITNIMSARLVNSFLLKIKSIFLNDCDLNVLR